MEKKEEISNHSRKFFIAVMIVLVLLSLFLVKSLIPAIIGGCLLAYIFHPVHRKLTTILKNKTIAAFLLSLVLVILIMIPIFFTANAVITQSISLFNDLKDLDVANVEQALSKFAGQPVNIEYYLKTFAAKLSAIIAEKASNFLFSLASLALSAFVMLFIMYYLFKDGEYFINRLEEDLPLKSSLKKSLIKRIHEVTYATVYGLALTAMIQGALGAAGFWFFDLPSPLLWGLVMMITSLIPVLGTALVWLPAAIYKLFVHEYFNGFGLLIFGILVISTIDNIIRPKIIGSRGNIHPALALLGAIGGLEVFGPFGLIIGPLILATTFVLVETYLAERKKAGL